MSTESISITQLLSWVMWNEEMRGNKNFHLVLPKWVNCHDMCGMRSFRSCCQLRNWKRKLSTKKKSRGGSNCDRLPTYKMTKVNYEVGRRVSIYSNNMLTLAMLQSRVATERDSTGVSQATQSWSMSVFILLNKNWLPIKMDIRE